jgi:hypothetical protein
MRRTQHHSLPIQNTHRLFRSPNRAPQMIHRSSQRSEIPPNTNLCKSHIDFFGGEISYDLFQKFRRQNQVSSMRGGQ